jgi:hypothetical protein
MSDWDAIFGEVALGLDPARVDLVPGEPGQDAALAAPETCGTGICRAPRAQAGQSDAAFDAASPRARSQRAGWPPLRLTSRPPAPTSDLSAIFRQEALEFRARGRDASAGVVRLGVRWIPWAYRLTLVLLVAVIASLWLVRTDERTSGPAVVDARTGKVAVLLPVAAGPDLASSRTFTVALPGGRSVRVSDLHAQLANGATVRSAGLTPAAQPAIVVTGRIAPARGPVRNTPAETPLHAQASVVLRTETLAAVLARQFNAMLGRVTAP